MATITARELMTSPAECVHEQDSIQVAAQRMKQLDVGMLPICGNDDRLAGTITDRDIVVKCVAEGVETSRTKVADYAKGKPVTIGADDSVEEAIRTMREHQVRRLPVIDGHTLVGMLAQADVARYYDQESTGDLVEGVSEPGH
ncbi:CBS domain-containing protein [Glutamicibacter sp. MNS18]|uniref:CBS domain-containing protein n=1 Tax=Glutamicibacter sp. MNS18 TaxID=2989817 RepID=UPI002236598E|nr:CBS domain-containing protein [Glutamicibacter sp. MNS18]MCW4465767.1 CBS domain-containing protein [Glutamicibacter sp. MNS18]